MKTLDIQHTLKSLGYNPGPLDGIDGPKTQAALALYNRQNRTPLHRAQPLPWMREITSVFGMHEVRDNVALSRWLRSDGRFLGDPAQLPWCGDAIDTAFRLTLTKEVLPPKLEENPYWARHWSEFGQACPPVFGAVVTFSRGSGGHVGFLIGVSRDGKLLRVRGGNQSDMVTDSWIGAHRLLASRWPSSVSTRLQKPAPVLDYDGGFVSTNEA